MKRLTVLFVSLGLVSLLLGGCKSGVDTKAFLSKQFTLAIGQSASISGENLNVRFMDVTEDSRCPKDVTCIWAGQVSCALEISAGGKIESVKLTQPGLSDTDTVQKVGAYTYKFTIEPYPQSGMQIQKKDYRLLLTVMK